jgi:hypothetical protein
LDTSHRGSGCVGPCGPPSVHASDDSFGEFAPVFDDPEQGLPSYSSFDGDDHKPFAERGDPPFFGPNFNGGGSGSSSPGGAPKIFTGVGGAPTGFLGKPPPPSDGSSPAGGGTTPPGGGDSPPSGGTTPPGGGTTPPGGGVTPPGGGGPLPAVPEPAAWALFLIGVGAVGAALRATRPPR